MEGFEPSHRLPGLPHFECGPFSHLGTSPDDRKYSAAKPSILYKVSRKRSIFFETFLFVLLTKTSDYNKIMIKVHS